MTQKSLVQAHDLVGQLFRWICFTHDPTWTRAQKYQQLDRSESPQIFIDTYDPYALSGRLNAVQVLALEKAAEFLSGPNHHCLVLGEPDYPLLLARISDPPFVLYAIGDLELLNSPSVAIVGSRRPTELGVRATQTFSAQLASMGITTVSGMALGIDGCTHQATLDAGGSTIAVLACGVDVVYPARHRALHQRICQYGLALSEYAPGTLARPFRFPERNRLVSGLSLGTLIVEAADKSGTLITARYCVEQNRDLFVVPGSLQSTQYKGSHFLIQQGAYLVTSAYDIVSVLAGELENCLSNDDAVLDRPIDHRTDELPLSYLQRIILNLIRRTPMSTDMLLEGSDFSVAEISSALLNLELEGFAGRTQDGRFYALF